ncbi:MAG TPA: transporter substrate-binding domain-containing protein [Actinomycetota bacterium]
MKRRWLVVVAVISAFGLLAAACGGNDTGGGGTETPTATGSETGSPAPSFTTLEQGKLTIGSDIPYPPFEFSKGGTLTGFDVELMDAVAQKLNLESNWVNANFNTIFTQLSVNKFDVVASAVTAYAPKGSPAYATTQKRAQIVAFAKPYYDSLQSLTTNPGKTPDLASWDQLKSGDRVGVQSGTTGEFWAQENLKPLGVSLVGYTKAPDIFNALEAGQLVGAVVDLPVAEDIVKTKPDLAVTQQIATGEQYAFAVNKSNTGLLDAINGAMDQLFADGTYASIFKKYFPTQEMPSYASGG